MKKQREKTIPDKSDFTLPVYANLFIGLEKSIGGKEGEYKQWAKISEFLDVEKPTLKTATEIYNAFKEAKNKFGVEIARLLYNSQDVVYPAEICNAAKYLSVGGNPQFVLDLAEAGFFMRNLQDAESGYMMEVTENMNQGDSARIAISKTALLHQQSLDVSIQEEISPSMNSQTM